MFTAGISADLFMVPLGTCQGAYDSSFRLDHKPTDTHPLL